MHLNPIKGIQITFNVTQYFHSKWNLIFTKPIPFVGKKKGEKGLLDNEMAPNNKQITRD
jgi:hypothetical protein